MGKNSKKNNANNKSSENNKVTSGSDKKTEEQTSNSAKNADLSENSQKQEMVANCGDLTQAEKKQLQENDNEAATGKIETTNKDKEINVLVTCHTSGPQVIRSVCADGTARFMFSNRLGCSSDESTVTCTLDYKKKTVTFNFNFQHSRIRPKLPNDTEEDKKFLKIISESGFEELIKKNMSKDNDNKKKSDDSASIMANKRRSAMMQQELEDELYKAYSSGNTFMDFKPASFSLLKLTIPMKYLKMTDFEKYPINLCFENQMVCLMSLPLSELGLRKFSYTYRYYQQTTLNFIDYTKRHYKKLVCCLVTLFFALLVMYAYRRIGLITRLREDRSRAIAEEFSQSYKMEHGDSPSMKEVNDYVEGKKVNVSFFDVCTDKDLSKDLGSRAFLQKLEKQISDIEKKIQEIIKTSGIYDEPTKEEIFTSNSEDDEKKAAIEAEVRELMLEKYRLKIFGVIGIPGTSYGEKSLCLLTKAVNDINLRLFAGAKLKEFTQKFVLYFDYFSAILFGLIMCYFCFGFTKDYTCANKNDVAVKLDVKRWLLIVVVVVKYYWHNQQVLDGPSRLVAFVMPCAAPLLANRDTRGALPTVALMIYVFVGLLFYPITTLIFVIGTTVTYYTKKIITKKQLMTVVFTSIIYPGLLYLIAMAIDSDDLKNSADITYLYKMLFGIKAKSMDELSTSSSSIKIKGIFTKSGFLLLCKSFSLLVPVIASIIIYLFAFIIRKTVCLISTIKKRTANKAEEDDNQLINNNDNNNINEDNKKQEKEATANTDKEKKKNKGFKEKEKKQTTVEKPQILEEPKPQTEPEIVIMDNTLTLSGAYLWALISSVISLLLIQSNARNAVITLFTSFIALWMTSVFFDLIATLTVEYELDEMRIKRFYKRFYNFIITRVLGALLIVAYVAYIFPDASK